jgi:5-hydroxyisourate hydrolase
VTGGSATISTHVLDATAGAPATGVGVLLEARGDGGWQAVADGATDEDGRLRFPDSVRAGTYRLTFGTGSYFAAQGVESFYPEVAVTFMASGGHYHVPLLLSPFAYSTYRGT